LPICIELQEQGNILGYGINDIWKKKNIFWRLEVTLLENSTFTS